jgi:hypothetical protein
MTRTVRSFPQIFPDPYRSVAPGLQARGYRMVAIGGPGGQPLRAEAVARCLEPLVKDLPPAVPVLHQVEVIDQLSG